MYFTQVRHILSFIQSSDQRVSEEGADLCAPSIYYNSKPLLEMQLSTTHNITLPSLSLLLCSISLHDVLLKVEIILSLIPDKTFSDSSLFFLPLNYMSLSNMAVSYCKLSISSLLEIKGILRVYYEHVCIPARSY